MKKGVIFDMDGLLFDTEQIWQKNWRELAIEFGQTPHPNFPRSITGTSGQMMQDVIAKHYPAIDAAAFMKECKKRVHDDVMVFVPEKPGLHEILEFFHQKGVKMAVASSSNTEVIINNLKKSDVFQYFEVILSGQDVEHGKPAPDIFLLAAEKLGLAAEDCYVFEDGINGVQAGIAAGCATIMIPDTLEPTEECREKCAGIYESLLVAMEAIDRGDV